MIKNIFIKNIKKKKKTKILKNIILTKNKINYSKKKKMKLT